MIKVVVVDDQALLRTSLGALIEAEPGLEVVGDATTGTEALRVVRETKPDVVLMDIKMPDLDGLTATRYICEDPSLAKTKILILSMFGLDDYVCEALKVGASGFLLKDSNPDQLIEAIHRIVNGEPQLSPSLMKKVLDHYVLNPVRTAPVDERLTTRETEVLLCVARGLSNPEIATELSIGTATVKTHISHLLRKLEARDRVQLVIFAYENNLVGH